MARGGDALGPRACSSPAPKRALLSNAVTLPALDVANLMDAERSGVAAEVPAVGGPSSWVTAPLRLLRGGNGNAGDPLGPEGWVRVRPDVIRAAPAPWWESSAAVAGHFRSPETVSRLCPTGPFALSLSMVEPWRLSGRGERRAGEGLESVVPLRPVEALSCRRRPLCSCSARSRCKARCTLWGTLGTEDSSQY